MTQDNVRCSRYDNINRAYTRMADLLSRKTSVGDEHLENDIAVCRTNLAELLESEARDVEELLTSSLLMPIDAGQKVLAEVQRLREEYS